MNAYFCQIQSETPITMEVDKEKNSIKSSKADRTNLKNPENRKYTR